MKILYVTPSFQHPAMRGPTRCYHFIKELSQRHKITLMALTDCEVAEAPMREMAAYTERIEIFSANGKSNSQTAAAFGRVPVVGKKVKRVLQRRAGIEQMKEAFAQLAQREAYDVVLFHGKSIFSVIENLDNRPLVIDFCDATSMRYQNKMDYASPAKRLWYSLRYRQIKQIEDRMIAKTPHVAFVSWRDREAVLGQEERGRIGELASSRVVPIGVDHRYWTRKTNKPRPNCLAFTGVMNYAPNEDAAIYLLEKIAPRVRRQIPNLEILLIGRDPTPALQEKAKQYPGITVTGFVDDVRPHLERASVFAAPLRYGSGIQNKVLEAMSMEIPVVTTPLAEAGLRVDGADLGELGRAGKPPVIVADGEEKFAKSLITLFRQKDQRERLAREGRRFVENHFVWSSSAAKLEEMCFAAVQTNGHK